MNMSLRSWSGPMQLYVPGLAAAAVLLLSGCGGGKPQGTSQARTPAPAANTSRPAIVASATLEMQRSPEVGSVELGTIGWLDYAELPIEQFEWFWRNDYHIRSLTYGDGVWGATLNRERDLGTQRILRGATFPNAAILSALSDGMRVTSIAYGDQEWAAVASEANGISSQQLITTSEFSMVDVQRLAADDYSVTALARDADTWAIVYSRSPDIHAQEILVGPKFPLGLIMQAQGRGLFLTTAAFGDQEWVAVLSRSDLVNQEIATWPDFPKGQLIEFWESGDYVDLRIFSGDGDWVVVGQR